MSPRKLLSFLLLGFVALSFVYLGVDAARRRRADPAEGDAAAGHQVVAYYFHATARCRTCLTIEERAREALDAGFPDELARRDLVWKPTNVDDPANEHFVTDFGLTSRTVVLAEEEDGRTVRFKVLDDVWELVGDAPAFTAYVQEETRAFLEP